MNWTIKEDVVALVFQMLEPGEENTVPAVTERLRKSLGLSDTRLSIQTHSSTSYRPKSHIAILKSTGLNTRSSFHNRPLSNLICLLPKGDGNVSRAKSQEKKTQPMIMETTV